MGIKDDLLADQAEREKAARRAKCKTCVALAELEPAARAEYNEDIMTDQSFQDRSIARWLSDHTTITVGEGSVDTHRKNHLEDA